MEETQSRRIIKPQEGYQEAALSCPADILIGGGSAGAGKTFSLLLEPLRHVTQVKGFNGVIFRRETPQITNPGGLWDNSVELYPYIGGIPVASKNTWVFKFGNKLKFSHLEYDKDVYNYQGSEIPFIGFDELTHFSKKQFFYMLSRNRSLCGVKPYIRATCNPDPDSWVAEFLEWWIDQETGYPIMERAGKIRYFLRDGENIVWGDNVEEVVEKCPHIFNLPQFVDKDPRDLVKSVTFIPGSIYDNKELMSKDPGYLGNLLALEPAEQLKLLEGNWKVRQDGTSLFNFERITDLFSNFVDAKGERFITCDAARFGRDLAVIKTWYNWQVVRIEIISVSKTTDITEAIEKERERVMIPKSNVLVDQDGLGGGVVDEGGYRGFSGGLPAVEDPRTHIKENYRNLKTQCAYRFADRVNNASVGVSLDNIIVNGVATDQVKIGSKWYSVKKLLTEDLRSIKRKDPDKEGKKQMNTKEEQKNILGGRSPDCGDAFWMREWFEICRPPEPRVTWLN